MSRYDVNYKFIIATLSIIFICGLILALVIMDNYLVSGIILIILLVGAVIFSITRLFTPQRIRRVTVTSTSIVIEYRKSSVEIPFEDIKKLEHYKHGPLTERIYVFAKPYKYEILSDLKHFHDLCRSIYAELKKIDKEDTADEWFQNEFGKNDPPKTSGTTVKCEDMGQKYSANFTLMWILYIIQLIFMLLVIILIWSNQSVVLSLVMSVILLFLEYIGVVVITSPIITRSITITGSNIIIKLKNKSGKFPITSFKKIEYHKPFLYPKRVYIYVEDDICLVLPWYIKNFRAMCKGLYQVLKKLKMESIAGKSFRSKFGNRQDGEDKESGV